MRDHATRRAIPTEQSILWKPVRDPHYVVASLQPNDGGRRKIFVRQQALGRVDALVRAHGRRTAGLLLGHFYICPITGADYVVIDSLVELNPVGDETAMLAAVADAVAAGVSGRDVHILGWYRGVPTVEAKPPVGTAEVHNSFFRQPWQTALVVGESMRGVSGGAFFLHDSTNSRWFYAPFYELPEHAPTPPQPKPTLVDWPQYMTSDNVVAAVRQRVAAIEMADVRPETSRQTPHAAPDIRLIAEPVTRRPGPPPPPTRDVVDPATDTRATIYRAARAQDEAALDAPPLSDRPAPRDVHGLADVAKPNHDRPTSRRRDRSSEKLSIVDDSDQRMAAPSSGRVIRDEDDTRLGDEPGRYIELARSEGFFIAARFETASGVNPPETLWILNEPYSGLLLAVAATKSEIVDATLHYNLQTDDAGLQRVAFPEHRDPESKTVYMRETCTDSLRARCRRLRETNALLREWRVTPTMSFLTPAEWESIPSSAAGMGAGPDAISRLNNARIAELPPGIRSQFHFDVPGEASA
jgi:hypothetical protein